MCKCYRRDCKSHNDTTFYAGGVRIDPCENSCELFQDATECEMFLKSEVSGGINTIITHDKCGLPVELCKCPDSRIKFDEETERFIDTDPTSEEEESHE